RSLSRHNFTNRDLDKFLKLQVIEGGRNYIENTQIGHELYQTIWHALEPYLEDIKKIRFSASGNLYQIAVEGLPRTRGGEERLLDRYDFNFFGRLSDSGKSSENRQIKSVGLMGGANFDVDSLTFHANLKGAEIDSKKSNTARISTFIGETRSESKLRNSVNFPYLKGTLYEVKFLDSLFRSYDWDVASFTGKHALEENFKSFDGQNAPGILHVASHGFFFNLYKGNKIEDRNLRNRLFLARNPLIRSGIALTGANYSWKGGIVKDGFEDGYFNCAGNIQYGFKQDKTGCIISL
ncbi:MAG: CHAT domain-containing protein, partial [Bacteroidota bacterium]